MTKVNFLVDRIEEDDDSSFIVGRNCGADFPAGIELSGVDESNEHIITVKIDGLEFYNKPQEICFSGYVAGLKVTKFNKNITIHRLISI